MKTNNNIYININGCLTKEGIKAFLQGDINAASKNEIEGHINSCELCKNAVLGYKKINDPNKIETANSELKARFSVANKKNKPSLLTNQYIINIITAAAVVVIAIIIVKNFTTIERKIESPFYTEDLALLSKDEIQKPQPPQGKIRKAEPHHNQTIIEYANEQPKNEIIEIAEQKNIAARKFPSKSLNQNLHGIPDKKLADKSYTEFQITLPVEVDRRGYSDIDDKLITASYEKGNVLSALPSFKGKGMQGFVEYVSKNIRYPEEAMQNQITGVVEVQFAVDVDGTVKDIEIKKGIDPILDLEAYRLIKNSPKWIPGFVNGKPTKVYLRFPVNFRIAI